MKQKYLILLFTFCCSLFVKAQTTTLPYNDDVYTSGYPSVTLNNFSTCQVGASLTASSQGYNGVWADRNFTLIVNGITIGSYTGTQTIDVSSYIPITSVQMNGNFYTWSWVDLTVNITSNTASLPANGPTVSNVNYCQGATATPLLATLNSTGTTLKWYTDQYGDNFTTTAPTPSTASVGTTSYFVSQANASGCESVRSQINVYVGPPPAPTATTTINYYQGQTPNALTATGTNLLWYTTSTGGTGSVTAPIPSTTTVGTTSYWVSQNPYGCEGARTKIDVIVNAIQTLPYNDDIYTSGYPSVILNNFSTCQVSASLTASSQGYNGVWADRNFTLIVNGINIGSFTGTQTIDISSYIPITSVQMNGNFYTWSWVDLTVNITSLESSMPITGPTVSNVNYCVGATASQLSATLNSTGTTLKWYTDQYGDNYSTTAPTPSTASASTTSYYVSQANSSGCESVRSQINVVVTAYPTNPSATTTVNYTVGDTASALTATGSNLLWYTVSSGGTGSTTAPIPSTASAGTTSYWVSQSNNGCESTRTEIQVIVSALTGTHLNFDGIDDAIDLGTTISNSLDGSDYFSAEAWINIPDVSGIKTIIGNHVGWGNTQFNFRIIDNTLNAFLGDGYYSISSSVGSIVANTWMHVAMVYNDATLKIYIDGTEVGSVNVPLSYSLAYTTPQCFIGKSVFGEVFKGNMEEVRVLNFAMTQTDIQNTMNCELQASQSGILAYYKFNQGIDNTNNAAVNTVIDSSGNGNTGTLVNFALTGASSNWKAGSTITSGNTCVMLSSNNFQIDNNVTLYPNPTSNVLHVEFKDLSNVTVELMDLNGRVLINQTLNTTSNTIDLSGYNTAIYLLKVSSNEGTSTYKIVKQ